LRGTVKTPEEIKGLEWKDIEKKAHDHIAIKNKKAVN
jgi:hypothetical protein